MTENTLLPDEEVMSLANIGKGEVIRKFDEALEEVLRDISDPNTSMAVRTIQITTKIAPTNEAKTIIGIMVSPDVKLPKEKPFATSAIIEKTKNGALIAKEVPRQQSQLPFRGKVVDIAKTK